MESQDPDVNNLNRKGRKMLQKNMERYAKYVNKKMARDRKKRLKKMNKMQIVHEPSQ